LTANDGYFKGAAASGSYLAARGFNARGNRSGGIVGPKEVQVPSGAILFRLYHIPGEEFGQWWSTANELAAVFDHFAREGSSAAVGRTAGKGILHAALAVRHDWSEPKGGGKPSADHLGRYVCARLKVPLTAYYGEGDDAPSDNQKGIQKAVKILSKSGSQVGVRQLFFPECWKYAQNFSVVDSGYTDSGLQNALRKHMTGPLPFE